MPHATEALTNGEKPASKFLSHITSYPVVSDGIETYKSNPVGKKTLELADGAYNRFAKPVEPYLERPYGYAKPYVQKADEMADNGLNKVEGHFPIVKEDTKTVVNTAKNYIFWPYSYLATTWQDEYNKTAKHNDRGPGITTSVLAIVSTELKIASDFFQVVADMLGPKYEESKKKGADYVRQAQAYKDNATEKAGEYAKLGQEKANEYAQKGQEYAQQGQDKASESVQQAQDKASEYSQQGKEKANQAQKAGQEKLGEAQKAGEEKTQQVKDSAKQTKEDAKQTKDEAKQKAQK